MKHGTYKHGKYKEFKIYEPKERIIKASSYSDRVVHRWYVENFMKPYFVPQFINTSYAGIEQIGKLVRVEFLIGTNNLTDRIGILEDVGASYILLRSLESGVLTYADIYSIKFVNISPYPFQGIQQRHY